MVKENARPGLLGGWGEFTGRLVHKIEAVETLDKGTGDGLMSLQELISSCFLAVLKEGKILFQRSGDLGVMRP
jgi:hypothetical protein